MQKNSTYQLIVRGNVTICTLRQSFSSLQDLSSCALSFLNSRKISLRVKKKLPQNKWFAWLTKKWTCHWFLPSVSLEKSFSKQTIKVLGQKQTETNALLQILLEKKHELQIRQKQIQGQSINRFCFQFQLNKNEASQKWKQCYSKYLEVVQGLFCNYFQKFRLHEGNYFANA